MKLPMISDLWTRRQDIWPYHSLNTGRVETGYPKLKLPFNKEKSWRGNPCHSNLVSSFDIISVCGKHCLVCHLPGLLLDANRMLPSGPLLPHPDYSYSKFSGLRLFYNLDSQMLFFLLNVGLWFLWLKCNSCSVLFVFSQYHLCLVSTMCQGPHHVHS